MDTDAIVNAANSQTKYVLHTVGPIVEQTVKAEDQKLLASCYQSCLELADTNKLKSIAFCCISTGVFHFPNDMAAIIAVKTVREYLSHNPDTAIQKIVSTII